MDKIKNEKGALIVEASIVFPTMFFILMFLFVVGNAYVQKCRIEEIVVSSTLEGAAHCADPLLDSVEADDGGPGTIPGFNEVNLQPYRYLAAMLTDQKTNVEERINDRVSGLGSGFFTGMTPDFSISNVKFDSKVIYSTVTVDATYDIEIPFKILGMDEFMKISYATHTDIPVSDVPEFIRNVDFAEDLVQRVTGSDISEQTGKLAEKITDWVGK